MTFEELDNITKNQDSLLTVMNESGELVTIKWNEERTVYETITRQSNGWLRINRYYKDGTCEEEYKK